ncbi:hypothetical protein J1N35_023582 [Gossypium stocksii]|uniref:Sugar phosphate transporter domain-containing protein n=1 Tax=Gossypium stocksii TaxID=47602 RepID=A0A9D3VJG1_9ROSI|nr:hypothetical protein J1N35_023582 [Gossypium stocksii]
MSFTLKQSALTVSNSVFDKRSSSITCRSLLLPCLNLQNNPKITLHSLSKPLYISSFQSFNEKPVILCKAYEADKSSSPSAAEAKSEAAKSVKIGIYFATWWALNVVFNIYNKKVLNAYPYPWLTSTLSLACGSLMMLVSWATKIAEPPKINLEFWKALFPVAVAHTIGHVAATVSMSKVAVSFTHIIKSGEPAFSVIVSRFLLGERFPPAVYLSLVPIIGGCGLAALTELNFNMTGLGKDYFLYLCFMRLMSTISLKPSTLFSSFMGAMISNLAFVFRNIFSKKGMKGKSISGMNYYACLSMLSLLILTPFAIAVEGPHMWAAGWKEVVSEIGPQFIWWVAAQSIFYHLYNQVSYMSLDEISPLTFSVGNTMKRISVIVSSIIIFRTPVQPINALGAAIAILGTFLYSQAKA